MNDRSNKPSRSSAQSVAVTRVLIVIAIALVCAIGTAASGYTPGIDLLRHAAAGPR